VLKRLLIGMFVPVFKGYTTEEAKKIEVLGKEINPAQNNLDSLKKLTTPSPTVGVAVPQTSDLETNIAAKKAEQATYKEPLERQRMTWLLGALAIVIFGLLFSYLSASRKPAGWGAMQYPQLV